MRLYFNPVRGSRKSPILWILLPIAVCVAIMLPRLLSPQFGMFDDGNTLTTSSRIVAGDLSLNYEADRGRFRPVYWLAPVVVYLFAGDHPFWYFFSNLVLLSLIVIFATASLRRLGVSPPISALMGILFILSGSTLENVYTLSKGELLMLLFTILALYTSLKLNSERVSARSLVLCTILSAVFLFLADVSKETALVFMPIAAGWLVIEWLAARRSHRKRRWPWLGSLFLAGVISFAVYWLVRNSMVITSLGSGSYTGGYNFTLEAIKGSIVRWTGWLLRDDFFLLPLLLFWVIAGIRSRKLPHGYEVLLIFVWLAGWIAVYLPWRFAQEYYLLPFDLGASILVVLLAVDAWQAVKEKARLMPVLAGGLLALTGLLWIVSMPNHVTDARIQLAVDSANQQMLDMMQRLPLGSTISLNIQYPNEYSVELGLLLQEVRGRSDIQIVTFDPAGQPAGDYYLTPFVENRPLLTFRMGVSEQSQSDWVNSLLGYLGTDIQPSWRVERDVPLLLVDLPRLFCPLLPALNFCATPRPIFDTRTFSYGWMLFNSKP